MAMYTNTFHFWLRNMNTFTPWEKSIWAQMHTLCLQNSFWCLLFWLQNIFDAFSLLTPGPPPAINNDRSLRLFPLSVGKVPHMGQNIHFWSVWEITYLHLYKRNILTLGHAVTRTDLSSHLYNATHQGISISQPCCEDKCMEWTSGWWWSVCQHL